MNGSHKRATVSDKREPKHVKIPYIRQIQEHSGNIKACCWFHFFTEIPSAIRILLLSLQLIITEITRETILVTPQKVQGIIIQSTLSNEI